MCLVAGGIQYRSAQLHPRVRLGKLDLEIEFGVGELIHTENSYKYDMNGIRALAGQTGFELSRTWLDSQERFSSNLLLAN